MKHPWLRTHDLANSFGLTLTALGVYLLGFQFKSIVIGVIGFISFLLFLTLFCIDCYLWYRDFFKIYLKKTMPKVL
ncbi:MAG: hypothetical protein AABX03_04990 [Nanoarchaeota archaeon]